MRNPQAWAKARAGARGRGGEAQGRFRMRPSATEEDVEEFNEEIAPF